MKVDVKEFEDQRGGFTLEFGFSLNPYFNNEKLVKVVRYDDGGAMVVDGTPPIWREGMVSPKLHIKVNPDLVLFRNQSMSMMKLIANRNVNKRRFTISSCGLGKLERWKMDNKMNCHYSCETTSGPIPLSTTILNPR